MTILVWVGPSGIVPPFSTGPFGVEALVNRSVGGGGEANVDGNVNEEITTRNILKIKARVNLGIIISHSF